MKEIIYLPWLGKNANWKEQVYNEIHLLVARVQGADSLSEQIEHGNDFVARFNELINQIIEQQ